VYPSGSRSTASPSRVMSSSSTARIVLPICISPLQKHLPALLNEADRLVRVHLFFSKPVDFYKALWCLDLLGPRCLVALRLFHTVPEDEQCRDVYAYFGLASYLAQCLEKSLSNFLLVHARATNNRLTGNDLNALAEVISKRCQASFCLLPT
jgi:hypothetical protein